MCRLGGVEMSSSSKQTEEIAVYWTNAQPAVAAFTDPAAHVALEREVDVLGPVAAF